MNHYDRKIVDRDPSSGAVRTTYRYPSEPPSIAIPLALQEVTDTGATDLEPMHDAASVDPDALDDLFRPTAGGAHREASVTFTYQGYRVAVRSYGRIVIRPRGTDRGDRSE